MNTCDTCKWWKSPEVLINPDNPTFYPNRVLGECSHPKIWAEMDDAYKEEPEGLDVLTAAAGDYRPAFIEVGPKFGCIHHEPK